MKKLTSHILSVIIIVLFFAIFFPLKGKNIFFFISNPFQKFFYRSNEERAENIGSYLRDSELEACRTENFLLKNLLDLTKQTENKSVIANVIGKRSEEGMEWFLLDKGARHGIRSGLAVMDENGVLVGILIKVEESISYLRSIFDSRSSLAADIITPGDNDDGEIVSGIVQGEYGLGIRMKYIPVDKQINPGDTVITSGLEENIRRGVIIGQVAGVEKRPNDIFQEAVIKSFSNQNFRVVSILIP